MQSIDAANETLCPRFSPHEGVFLLGFIEAPGTSTACLGGKLQGTELPSIPQLDASSYSACYGTGSPEQVGHRPSTQPSVTPASTIILLLRTHCQILNHQSHPQSEVTLQCSGHTRHSYQSVTCSAQVTLVIHINQLRAALRSHSSFIPISCIHTNQLRAVLRSHSSFISISYVRRSGHTRHSYQSVTSSA